MRRPTTTQDRAAALAAHNEYRAGGYRTLAVRLERSVDDRGKARKSPRFAGGTWAAAEAIDPGLAIHDGYLDIAVVCDVIGGLDFDIRKGEQESDARERMRRVYRAHGLGGAIVEHTGNGLHVITRAPAGEWRRRIWGPPHDVDEVRCGRDAAGNGLLLFVAPSWHPVAERYYERAGPIVPVVDLPECPRALLEAEPPVKAPPFRIAGPIASGRGDWRTLDVVGLFRAAGMYKKDLGRGKHGVTCPWDAEHSTGSDGTDTAVWPARDGHGPGFECRHAHCAERDIRDVRAFFGANTVDRFCLQPFQPTRAWEWRPRRNTCPAVVR